MIQHIRSRPLPGIDAVDVVADNDTAVVCAFGDSITDGTSTTISGDDRWSNDLSRRLHEVYGNKVWSMKVSAEIRSSIPLQRSRPVYGSAPRCPGLGRLIKCCLARRDQRSWANHPVLDIIAGYQNVVFRLHNAGIKVVIGCTLTSALLNTGADGGPVRTPGGNSSISLFAPRSLQQRR